MRAKAAAVVHAAVSLRLKKSFVCAVCGPLTLFGHQQDRIIGKTGRAEFQRRKEPAGGLDKAVQDDRYGFT